MSFDLLIAGGQAFTPSGLVEADIGIVDGRIAAIGSLDRSQAAAVYEAKGLTVLPGAIDTQVHFREPGAEYKEDIATGTAAAALGGVTAICEMPNTSPPTTTADLLRDKLRRAEGRAWVDHAFFAGASPEAIGTLGELEKLPGCAGIKMFMGSSTGSLLVAEEGEQAWVLADGFRRIAVHAEDEVRLTMRKKLIFVGQPVQHPDWRDVTTAVIAVERLLRLARAAGRRVHVLHVTSADEMAILAKHKDIATVETTPQHLTFASPEIYERLGNYAQMNPPIRTAEHREGLWKAVREGVVDVIGSDHAPHTREEKEKPYPNSPSGMPGVQTLVPVMLDHVAAGRLTLARFVDLTAAGPARIYGMLGKGRLAVGYDGDATVVDLKRRETITDAWIASRCGWTPFNGMEVTGWPVATIQRGRVVMRDGALQGQPGGRPLRFMETLRS